MQTYTPRPNYLLWVFLLISLLLHLGLFLKIRGLVTPREWVYAPVELSSFTRPQASAPLPSPPKVDTRTPVPLKASAFSEPLEDVLPTNTTPPQPAPPVPSSTTPRFSTPQPNVDPMEVLSEWQTAQGRFNRYAAMIRARIEEKKRYPLAARHMGMQGVTTVRFVITSSGELVGVEVVRSSGSRVLDEAALKAVREAAPFPRPPHPFDEKPKLTFVVSLTFQLR